ncbi:LysR family transcriptional regulator [Granulosicoccus sp. 3-233]|uniref:LysR family transcriptional regulator n=1 Tax=Granulosicoccus sp. 3-233 TaxID=3417969 RepID=UPI003D358692
MITYPDIRDLQMLLALARRRHFTQAAADCGISQPAFSARIRHLEEDLGVPIVRRGNRFLGFTPDGERVIRWASKLLVDAEGLRQDMEVARGELRGKLVLGVVPTALPFAADISTRLRSMHPGLAIEIASQTSSQIVRALGDYSVDAGIVYRAYMEGSSLRFEPIYEERYVLLVSAELAPRTTGTVSWREAAGLPLCLLGKDMHFRRVVDDAFLEAGVQPEPVMETNAFTAVLAQVAIGTAATIAPQSLADSLLLSEQTIRLPLVEPEAVQEIGIAVQDHELSLPAIAALHEAIRVHDRQNELLD